jgi:Flp pilus assembly protein TadG
MIMIRRSKVASNQTGTTILEFALIAIIVLGLLFAIVDLSLMLFANLAMQHAVRSGARYAVTGPNPDTAQPQTPQTRFELVKQKIKDNSIGFCGKNTCNINFYSIEDPSTPITGNNVGASQEIIIVEVKDYSWSLLTPLLRPFFPGGKYTFTVKATMRNEPFPES